MSTSSAATISSYAALQAYMSGVSGAYQSNIASAPHGAFWKKLSHDQFVTGNVPGVSPEVPILIKGNGAGSNIVLALQGQGPLFSSNGRYGQMPADETGPWTTAQIAPLIAWIDAGCPDAAA